MLMIEGFEILDVKIPGAVLPRNIFRYGVWEAVQKKQARLSVFAPW
jgi:hypothetical protein